MQKIVPNLWLDHNAEKAVAFYLKVFPNSRLLSSTYYPTDGLEDFQKDFAGQVLTIRFEIMGQEFVAINAGDYFKFSEAVSFAIICKDQEEIDYYWDNLTSDGGVESPCGWLKDKYGLSWQVVPEGMEDLMQSPNAFKNMMQMKKIIISDLS